jgi:type I restriction enzyme M protein
VKALRSKRCILEVLHRDDLLSLVQEYDLEVADKRVRQNLIDALVRSRTVRMQDILSGYSRDYLKSICEALELVSLREGQGPVGGPSLKGRPRL